jgi:non-heme Fe2+,alpha-ketoglutarate-dependent halogenase
MDNRDLSFSSIKNNSPKFLSTKDIDKYNLDGFVAPFNAFSNSEMIKIRKSVDELFLKLESYNDGRDSYSINCYQHKSKTIWNIINNEKILNYVEDLTGPNIICWASHFFNKLPNDKRPVPFHQDASYWLMSPARTVTVWLAIDDTDKENAPMEFLPGSHKVGPLPWKMTDQKNPVLNQEITGLEKFGKPYLNVLKAGDFSIHADMIAHGSLPNSSNRRRCGLTIRYCNPLLTKPLHPMYAEKSILCRGKKPTSEWSKCKTEIPTNDDLSIIESNPIVDLPNPQSFH